MLPAHLRASLRPVPGELVIGPVQARVQGHFAPRRAAALAGVTEALDSPRYAALLAELGLLTAGPLAGRKAGAPARAVLPKAVRKACRQADRRMRRARHTPPGHTRDVALHQARKSARRARYAAEAAAPASRPARRFAKQMKKVQSALGEHRTPSWPASPPATWASARTWPARTPSPTASSTSTNATRPSASSPPPAKPGRRPPAPATSSGSS